MAVWWLLEKGRHNDTTVVLITIPSAKLQTLMRGKWLALLREIRNRCENRPAAKHGGEPGMPQISLLGWDPHRRKLEYFEVGLNKGGLERCALKLKSTLPRRFAGGENQISRKSAKICSDSPEIINGANGRLDVGSLLFALCLSLSLFSLKHLIFS